MSSDFILVKDLGQGTQNPVTDGPGTKDVFPEAQGHLLNLSHLPIIHQVSQFLHHYFFPVADIDRILHAGFTLQEVLEALQQVCGNADLALLILVAKNIVVPI